MSVAAIAAKHPDLDWSDRTAVAKAMREHDEQQNRELDQRREEEEREFAADREVGEAAAKAAAPAAETATEDAPAAEAEAAPAEAVAEVTAAEAELAALREQMDALSAENAELNKQIGARAKTDTAAKREAMLKKLTDEYGEDHVLVEEAKLRYGEMDRLDAAIDEAKTTKAAAEQTVEEAGHRVEHEQTVKATPFLKSIYDSIGTAADGKVTFSTKENKYRYATAMSISKELLEEKPNLSMADHYKAVEGELLKLYPAAKAQFYGSKTDTKAHPKVVSMSDLPGGKSAVPGAQRKATREDLFAAVLKDPTKSSLEHARALGIA